MIRTKVTRTLALAGFGAVAAAILSVSASWTAFGETPEAPAAQSEAKPAFSVLYTFTGGTDGSTPTGYAAPLILDRLGNIYGTTPLGGDLSCGNGFGCGVVFKVDQRGTETVLYSFTGAMDGGQPQAGVVRDAKGNLYGTTLFGGGSGLGAGTVFKLDPVGKESVLWGFSGGTDGNTPYAGVVRDEAGNLYGTTLGGGPANAGVVYKLDLSRKQTVLYAFAGPPSDGSSPSGNLLRDKAGNLYGTTYSGGSGAGAACFGSGCGAVFMLDPDGKETVLYSFTGGADGASPYSGLIRDRVGNLYGTTGYGGSCSVFGLGCGVVFKLDQAGKETVLYTFTGGTDGGVPYGGLVRDAAGNLYGTSNLGGDLSASACAGYGCGVVFRVDPSGKETVLYAFTGLADGQSPYAGLVSNAGNCDCTRYELYGTTGYGGDLGASLCGGSGCGVVFKLTLPQACEPDPN